MQRRALGLFGLTLALISIISNGTASRKVFHRNRFLSISDPAPKNGPSFVETRQAVAKGIVGANETASSNAAINANGTTSVNSEAMNTTTNRSTNCPRKCSWFKEGEVKILEDCNTLNNSRKSFLIMNEKTISQYFKKGAVGSLEVSLQVEKLRQPGVFAHPDDPLCLALIADGDNKCITLCLSSRQEAQDWTSAIVNQVRCLHSSSSPTNQTCSGAAALLSKAVGQVPDVTIETVIYQPMLLVPGLPRPDCNARWDYSSHGDDWQCECKLGRRQSPIDFPDESQMKLSLVDVTLKYRTARPMRPKQERIFAVNTMHSVQIDADFGELVLPGAPVYLATSIHFHSPSEHLVNGRRFPLEIHVAHRASEPRDGWPQVVMVAVLFEQCEGPSCTGNELLRAINTGFLPFLPNGRVELREPINLLMLWNEASRDRASSRDFYSYQGSFATPSCDESVRYFVFSEPVSASFDQIKAVRQAIDMDSRSELGGNYRNVQPLNGREIKRFKAVRTASQDRDESCKKCEESKAATQTNAMHWEKRVRPVVDYVWVSDSKPSAIPGAIPISEHQVPEHVRRTRDLSPVPL